MRHTNRRLKQDRRKERISPERRVTNTAQEELKSPVKPKTEFQREILRLMEEKSAVFINGPAGTGKTFMVMSTAIDWLKQGRINKIILSRPSVGMGETLGFLKGDLREKFEPYLAAMVEVIKNRYGPGFYESQLGNGNIEFVPLEYVRGRSFGNAVVIVDEFQNTDPATAYTILTRPEDSSTLICLGDITQNDMKTERTGLDWAIDFVDRHRLFRYVEFVESTSDEIVRGGMCKAVVKARELDIENGVEV